MTTIRNFEETIKEFGFSFLRSHDNNDYVNDSYCDNYIRRDYVRQSDNRIIFLSHYCRHPQKDDFNISDHNGVFASNKVPNTVEKLKTLLEIILE